jgi:hypothetical protein
MYADHLDIDIDMPATTRPSAGLSSLNISPTLSYRPPLTAALREQLFTRESCEKVYFPQIEDLRSKVRIVTICHVEEKISSRAHRSGDRKYSGGVQRDGLLFFCDTSATYDNLRQSKL